IKFDINSKIYKKKIIEYELELGRNRRYPSYLKTMSQYFRKNLKINYKEAIEYCHNYIDSKTQKLEHQFNDGKIQIKEFEKGINKVGNQYIQRITSVKNLHYGKKSKSLKFNRNSTNKRIDTNLTFMAKDIRKFIKGVENMSYLDLSNSQPVLFNILLKKYYKNNNEKLNQEIKHYYLITISGNWYEELCDIFRLNYKCTDDRNKAKKIWMKIAYSKNGDYKVLKNKFNKHYPEINSLMEKLKKKCHKDFAIKLQRIESKIFIDEICKTLVEKDIIPYSIHDGVLVPKEYEAKTYHIMIETLKKHLGSVPVISINDEKVYHQTSKEENLMIQFEKHFST
ncbi:hypothetical protein, partial [Winogradskyella sp.]|uniref:hypothetical protein n=1 Tax=Winogradskyella sp. TaxID=1883156 RepID=UPI003AB3DC8C